MTATISALLALPVWANEFTVGDLTVMHAHSYATPPNARNAVAYMMIENHGATADRLVAVQVDFAMAMLHETSVDANGVATMTHLMDGVEIQAMGMVEIQQGGLHIMLTNMSQHFAVGDHFDMTLSFEQAGDILIDVMVLDHMDMHSHSEMDYSTMHMSN